MSEETFLLWGLYVPRVKSKPAARERPFHDNCFSLPSISERGQERHLKTRGFVLIVTEAPGDITGYRRLHTSRGGASGSASRVASCHPAWHHGLAQRA